MSFYLVTGGAGFIGSHLAEVLVRRGHRVWSSKVACRKPAAVALDQEPDRERTGQASPELRARAFMLLADALAAKASARLLTAPQITAHNTFQEPDNVKPAAFDSFKLTETGVNTVLPPKSVVLLELE